MRQTIKQYMASVKKAGAPDDMRHCINAWPYPQAKQSNIEIYRDSWGADPNKHLYVSLINSDMPGALMRVAEDAPSPSEIAQALRDKEEA